MIELSRSHLETLFDQDETAWLEQMARLVGEHRYDELDYENLKEYLLDMARRDKREVLSRLTVLLAHLLKWQYQPEQRSRSWEATISLQRQELDDLLESQTLLQYAQEALDRAYARAVKQAAIETGLSRDAFPAANPYALDAILHGE